jgi:hypothetical protein
VIDLDKAYKYLHEIWDTKIDDKNVFGNDDERFSYLYFLLATVEKMLERGWIK